MECFLILVIGMFVGYLIGKDALSKLNDEWNSYTATRDKFDKYNNSKHEAKNKTEGEEWKDANCNSNWKRRKQ